MKRAWTILLLAASAPGLLGCQLLKKKNADAIGGSCTRPNDTFSGGTSRCRERKGREPSCISEETKSDKPCPRDAFLVAGCRGNDGFKDVEWVYSDPAKGGTATVESVGTYCVSIARGTTLMADGSEKSSSDVVGDEVKKYEATHGAKARATLANIATLAARLPAPTGKVDLQGLKGDVLLVHKEDLGSLESPKKLEYRIEETGKLAACSRMLNKRQLPSDHAYDIESCAKNPFIAVVSVTSYAPPTASGSSVSGNTKTTYVKKGTISGDLLVFRTDTGKYLGSTPIGASEDSATSPQIMTERLLEKWPGAVRSQMKQAAPGITSSSFTLKK